MKQIIAISLVAFLFSCKQDPVNTDATPAGEKSVEMIQLENQVAQLKLENANKDSVINESLAFFNEIQDNLAKISLKNDEIQIMSNNPEISIDNREWILQEINNINHLREQNARKVRLLQSKLKNSDLKIASLEETVNKLVLQIRAKDEQIESLQNELGDLDVAYSELFDEYQQQVELALDVMNDLNTAHYAVGTLDELQQNNVVVKEGGFIGIGKKTELADDMNDNYFTKIDIMKKKEITVSGTEPKLITDHPSSSYNWNGNKLVISNPKEFWKVSKYLVIAVK